MQQANTIEEAKQLFSQYKNFCVDISKVDVMEFTRQMQDDLECEIDIDYNTNKAIILIP